MSPVQAGDKQLIPALSEDHAKDVRINVWWQQDQVRKGADYYVLTAKNSSQGDAGVAFFVEVTRYDSHHLGPKNSAGFYGLTMDNRSQYGQHDAVGDGRFVVFHNEDYKLLQHRFVESTWGSKNSSAIL